MTKVMIKKIETCHDCSKLKKAVKNMRRFYDEEPPKTFLYACLRREGNRIWSEKALTTHKLMETCPLQDYEDVIKE